jgi:hypothetical protein
MSSPPISPPALEVLRALGMGLRLECSPAGKWAFVGPAQIPENSGVPLGIIQEIFDSGLASASSAYAVLSADGLAYLNEEAKTMLLEALEWSERISLK